MDIIRDLVEQGSKADTDAFVGKLRKWVFGALLIASDEVVLAHDRFLNASKAGQSELVIAAVADVVLAMRRDAGLETTGLEPIDIIATFIKAEDIDKMRPICEEWAKQRGKAWRLPRTPATPRS